jgi:hypothetical protein
MKAKQVLCVKKLIDEYVDRRINEQNLCIALKKICKTKRICSSISPFAFSMAAYRAEREEEYGVTNWKIVNAAVL